MKASQAARNALENVLEAAVGERLVIVCDEEKKEIGKAFADGALALGLWTRLVMLETDKQMRSEVPPHLLEILSRQKPDVYVNLMRESREETPFRIKITKLETRDHRSRLGHCPGVTMDMLTGGALALTAAQHKKMQSLAERLMHVLEGTEKIELRTPSGTQLSMNVKDRPFFTDTKLDWKTMKWMNLPTGEVLAAPVENSLSGRLICDMAIGGIGHVKAPVEMIVNDGKAEKISADNKEILRDVKETLATDEWSNVVGEFAFGINSQARFTEEFLEAEKILGTVHIAFGANLDFPNGKNSSINHMDFLMNKPTVNILKENAKPLTILENGQFQI